MDHEVRAVRPGKKKQKVYGLYSQQRWQWAEKHAQELRDHGCTEVEIRDKPEDEEDE